MPVVQRGELAGLVSIGDAVRFRLAELEETLTNVQSIVSSIAHEVRQPLAAIAANGGAALRFLEKTPVKVLNAGSPEQNGRGLPSYQCPV